MRLDSCLSAGVVQDFDKPNLEMYLVYQAKFTHARTRKMSCAGERDNTRAHRSHSLVLGSKQSIPNTPFSVFVRASRFSFSFFNCFTCWLFDFPHATVWERKMISSPTPPLSSVCYEYCRSSDPLSGGLQTCIGLVLRHPLLVVW